MQWWAYLFDTKGFPQISTYGNGWEKWLIFVFIAGKVATVLSCAIFVAGFALAILFSLHHEIDMEEGKYHFPRVAAFLLAAAISEGALNLVQTRGIYWPAYRFIGLMGLMHGTILFATACKVIWALILCRNPCQKGSA